MAEPVFVIVKTALFPSHEPDTLTLDLSHSDCVGVLVGVSVGITCVFEGVSVGGTGVLVGGTGVLVGGTDVLVGTVVFVGVLAGVLVGGMKQFPGNFTEPLFEVEKPSDQVEWTVKLTFPV